MLGATDKVAYGDGSSAMFKSAFVMAVAVIAAVGVGLFMIDRMQEMEQTPSEPAAMSAQSLQPPLPAHATAVPKSKDGHYWVEARVNDRAVRFLVDTGASLVALTTDDARRLGINVSSLTYDRPVMTANGKTAGAEVTLTSLSVGESRVTGVRAMVIREGLSTSLLGMSYLGRLSRIEATPSSLILHP